MSYQPARDEANEVIGVSIAVSEVKSSHEVSTEHSERRETSQRRNPQGWFLAAVEP